MSPQQLAHERYHSPAERAARLSQARRANEAAVDEAHGAFADGDRSAAERILFDAGLSDDGIAYYLGQWSDPRS